MTTTNSADAGRLRLEEMAREQGWTLTPEGWVHPQHDDPENDPPFKTIEQLDSYAQLLARASHTVKP